METTDTAALSLMTVVEEQLRNARKMADAASGDESKG